MLTLEIKHVLLSGAFFLCTTFPVAATDLPSFPQCPIPGGVKIASYDNGTHGIAGRSETYTGSDAVYSITSSQVVQCYCPDGGQGIQTDWWDASPLNSEEKADYTKRGWVYIQDGAAWGLASHDWLAYNHPFTCGESGGGTSDPGESGAGSVLSRLPSILGFADTGRARMWRTLMFVTGMFFTITGVLLFTLASSEKKSKGK